MVTKVEDEKVEHVFEPDRLEIAPGDTVRWEVENGTHDTVAFHPHPDGASSDEHEGDQDADEHQEMPLRIPEGAKPWRSDHLRTPGESFEYTFTVEGVYNYYCHPHEEQGMAGLIVVGKPMPGPGLMSPQTELPEAIQAKLQELIAWAKTQKGAR
jgi:plastocyanin